MVNKIMLCDCGGSFSLDAKAIAKASKAECSKVHNALCTSGLGTLTQELPKGGLTIACAQQASLFSDLALELGAPIPTFVDIRDRAAWSDDTKKAMPKIAALLAQSRLKPSGVKTFDVESEGMCLVIGKADVALPVAQQLAEVIDVTVLLCDTPEITPMGLDIYAGNIRRAKGTLGRFEVFIERLRALDPTGRGALAFGKAKDGAISECDIILDLSGDTPLFSAPEKRDGYLRADPRDPLAVSRAVFEAAQMQGTFEKPLYVAFENHLCAHSRAEKPGCNRCLNICPTGAITSNGDSVHIDPNICAGCGSCAAVCPSGAVLFNAPNTQFLFTQIHTLASAYLRAGGKAPRLLVHDDSFGVEMIQLAARFGRGLPGDVIPLATSNLAGFGHAEMLVALACGFVAVDILLAPGTERDALVSELALARAMVDNDLIRIIEPHDPDAFCELLYQVAPASKPGLKPILPVGGRREATRLALAALTQNSPVIDLPDGAPYGAVLVDNDKCTLCLSCASLCPTGALADNPDKPELSFVENACLQCGICASTCPEKAIKLLPRFDLSMKVFDPQILHEEHPYECINCGKPFGVKSTIERIVERLAGSHPLFTGSDNERLIRMCDTCRIESQYHSDNAPMFGGLRQPTVTTEDYLKNRKPN